MEGMETTMSTGLERLLAHETNLSDLLAYLTEREPKRWEGIAASAPAEVLREGGAGTRKRADLVLRGPKSEIVGAVEIKLGHHLSTEQRKWYETVFAPEVPLILASLDDTESALEGASDKWVRISLADLVGRWRSSTDAEVATIAAAMHGVLTSWSGTIAAVSEEREVGAAPLDTIGDPFLARVLTRNLQPALLAGGAETVYAGTTSGGGNAILQAWVPLPSAAEGEHVIAEVRWAPRRRVMDLRFGLDFGESSRSSRAAVWARAQQMDDVIRAERFIEHVENLDSKRATLISSKKPSGRPTAKGDWSEIVERGFRRGDATFFNPGFHRDGDTRFEATARIDTSKASGPDVVALLCHALRYLVSAV